MFMSRVISLRLSVDLQLIRPTQSSGVVKGCNLEGVVPESCVGGHFGGGVEESSGINMAARGLKL